MPAYARPPGAADPRAPGGAGLALRRFGAVPALAGLALFLLLPLAALLVEAVAGGAGLWGRLVADPLFGPAVRRTVALGAATATLSLAAGLLLARAVARLGARARQVMTVLLGVPLTFSGLVIAYGLILAYGRAGFVTLLAARAGADPAVVGAWIYSTAGLVFAYAYYLVPRVTLILVPLFVNLDRRPVEAALTLGARPWRAWADTAGRELAPTLAAVWCLVCAIAMGSYGTALALAGTQVNILPLLLYMKVSDSGSDFPLAAALSIVLLGLCTVVLALGEALSGVRDRQAGSP